MIKSSNKSFVLATGVALAIGLTSIVITSRMHDPASDPGNSGAAFKEHSIVAGTDYEVLTTPIVAPKNQVLEFFSYDCEACMNADRSMQTWVDQMASRVQFARIPMANNESSIRSAKTYAAASILGLTSLHAEIYNQYSGSDKAASPILTFAQYGVDEKLWSGTLNSEGVSFAIASYQAQAHSAGITAAPAIVIAGKYRISASQISDSARVAAVIEFLLKQEMGSSGSEVATINP